MRPEYTSDIGNYLACSKRRMQPLIIRRALSYNLSINFIFEIGKFIIISCYGRKIKIKLERLCIYIFRTSNIQRVAICVADSINELPWGMINVYFFHTQKKSRHLGHYTPNAGSGFSTLTFRPLVVGNVI